MSKNWIAEQWRPFSIRCVGSPSDEIISSSSVVRQFDSDNSNQVKSKIKTNVSADDFLKNGKISLVKKDIGMEDPVFVHFEFDNFIPWNLKKSS